MAVTRSRDGPGTCCHFEERSRCIENSLSNLNRDRVKPKKRSYTLPRGSADFVPKFVFPSSVSATFPSGVKGTFRPSAIPLRRTTGSCLAKNPFIISHRACASVGPRSLPVSRHFFIDPMGLRRCLLQAGTISCVFPVVERHATVHHLLLPPSSNSSPYGSNLFLPLPCSVRVLKSSSSCSPTCSSSSSSFRLTLPSPQSLFPCQTSSRRFSPLTNSP